MGKTMNQREDFLIEAGVSLRKDLTNQMRDCVARYNKEMDTLIAEVHDLIKLGKEAQRKRDLLVAERNAAVAHANAVYREKCKAGKKKPVDDPELAQILAGIRLRYMAGVDNA